MKEYYAQLKRSYDENQKAMREAGVRLFVPFLPKESLARFSDENLSSLLSLAKAECVTVRLPSIPAGVLQDAAGAIASSVGDEMERRMTDRQT